MEIKHSEEKIEELRQKASMSPEGSFTAIVTEAIEYGYSQGIEVAKKAVATLELSFSTETTEQSIDEINAINGYVNGHSTCRAETLKNLESLSLDSTKE